MSQKLLQAQLFAVVESCRQFEERLFGWCREDAELLKAGTGSSIRAWRQGHLRCLCRFACVSLHLTQRTVY